MSKLTDKAVRAFNTPGRYSDGGNLYLQVGKTGSKSWLFMYRWEGKQKEMGLGPYPEVSLAVARREALKLRESLKNPANPQDPLAARQAARAEAKRIPTFGAFSEQIISSLEQQWRNPKHRQQWRNTLAQYAGALADKPVDKITTEDVLKVLRPIWTTIPETASRVRGRIEKILDAARAMGHRSGDNPARLRGHIDHLLPKRQKLTRGHHAAMPYAEVPAFVADLRQRDSTTALALEFLILTAARSGEVMDMVWSEVDWSNTVWTIPAERMKAGKLHRVPLTKRAMDILHSLAPAQGAYPPSVPLSERYVFQGQKRRKGGAIGGLSVMALTMQMRRMGQGHVTVHGFRSAFRDWVGDETDFAREIAEEALAHTLGNQVELAYRRSDSLDKRRRLMDAWAAYLNNESAA